MRAPRPPDPGAGGSSNIPEKAGFALQGVQYQVSAGVAPHANTQRSSRTVATGKRGLLIFGHAHLRISVIATTPNYRLIGVRNSSQTNPGPIARLVDDPNTANQQDEIKGPYYITAAAAEVYEVVTEDASTGGEMAYNGTGVIWEWNVQ